MPNFNAAFKAFVALASATLCLNATNVVGVWTGQAVTMVADSKITVSDREGKLVRAETGCKVHVVRDVVVATAGLLKNESVDVIDSVKGAKEFKDQETGKRLPDMGAIIAAQQAVEKALARRGDEFDPFIAVSLLIAAVEDGELTLTRAEWIPLRPDQQPKDGTWNRYGSRRFRYPENRRDAEDPDRGIEIIGVSDAIKRFKKTASREEWNDPDAVRFAKKLVKIEASDVISSRVVGEPLTVVTIDKNGPKWIERGACKD